MLSFIEPLLMALPHEERMVFVKGEAFTCLVRAVEERKKALINGFLDGRFPGDGLPGVLLREQEVGRALEAETTLDSLREIYTKLTQ